MTESKGALLGCALGLTSGGALRNTTENFRRILDDSGVFGEVKSREYEWTASYSTRDYVELLGTHSDHRMLETPVKLALQHAIAEAIDAHGGQHQVPYVAVLALAHRG